MIPKIIHCCWFGGNPMPSDVKTYMDGWKKNNPDYKIIIWNEENFDYKSNRYAKEAYDSKKWAFVTDYARLKVLYDYGGIYMDTDVESVRGFDSLLSHKAFSGFEDDRCIPTGTMGAEKGSQWIKLLLDYYQDRSFFTNSGEMDLTTNVITISRITAEHYPLVLENSYQDLGDVTLYPFDVLCAKSKIDGIVRITENTVTIHHFKGSWTTPKVKFIKLLNKYVGHDVVVFFVNLKRLLQGKERI